MAVMALLLALSWVVGAYAVGWWMGHHRKPFLFWQRRGPIRQVVPPQVTQELSPLLTPETVQRAEQRLSDQSPVFKHLSPTKRAAVVKRLAGEAQQLFGGRA